MKRFINILLAGFLSLAITGCSSAPKEEAAAEPEAASYTAGTYEGVGVGRNGDINVSVTFSEDAITDIVVTEHNETPFLSTTAIETIAADVIQYQSLGVDLVTGASFTSRGLLNGIASAVEKAGGNVDALKAVKPEITYATEDLSTQVLVVGGGTAGLVAALTAAEAGAQVTLVEKLDVLGGTLSEAAGLLLTVDAETNDPSIDDSIDTVMNFYQSVNADSVHQPDYDFTKAVMSETGKTVDMLTNEGYDTFGLSMGNYAGTIFTVGYVLAEELVRSCEANGVFILTGTAAKSLVVEDGAVKGAVVENRSGEYTISADKVIVATGGASWGKRLKDSQAAANVVDVHEKAQIGSNGDGMDMLEAVGAKMADDVYIKSSQPDFANCFKNDWSNTPSTGMTILVNADGKRFTSEAQVTDTVLNAKMIAEASPAYWNIIDGNNTVGFDETYFGMVKEFAADDNEKVAVYADTIEELAGKIGVDAAALQETIDSYNAGCAAGADEFGKDASFLKALPEDGGYYAVYRRIGSWGTIGGAIIDENMNVIDVNGDPIPNLYAAGEVATAQLFGDYYFGGFSLGLYTTCGRLAAEAAVAGLE